MNTDKSIRRLSTAKRVRQTAEDVDKKLEVIRAAARHCYPVTDIGRMLAETEEGRWKSIRSGTIVNDELER
jgi:hypothetical protein